MRCHHQRDGCIVQSGRPVFRLIEQFMAVFRTIVTGAISQSLSSRAWRDRGPAQHSVA